jgi:hypothetical protein
MVIIVVCILDSRYINPLNAKFNPVCHLLALVGAHPIFHVSRTRVKILQMCVFIECFCGKYTLNQSKMNCAATVLRHRASTGAEWRTDFVVNENMKTLCFGNVHWTGLLQVWGLMVRFCVMMCSICFRTGADVLYRSVYLYMGAKISLSR